MNWCHKFTLAIIACFAVQTIPSFADTEWIDSGTFTPSGSPVNNSGVGSNGRLGERIITAGTTITITRIGVYVVAGSTHTHLLQVKREGSCSSTVISESLDFNGLSAGVHYVTLGSPVTLNQNDHYYAFVQAVDGEDSFYLSQSISTTSDMACHEAAYALDAVSCSNSGTSSDVAHGPVFLAYTVGGGGNGEVGNLVRLDNEFMAGFTLPVSVGWTNSDTINQVLLYSSTNGSAFGVYSIHNAGATNSNAIYISQNEVWSFKVGLVGNTNFSNTIDIWGYQKIINFALQPSSTNAILFTFTDIASSNSPGALIQQATNSTFTGNTVWITVPQTNGFLYTYTYNYAFEFNQRYWFRAYATNADGHLTGVSSTINSAPNSLPEPPNYFNAYNVKPSPNVEVRWTDLRLSLIQEWTIQISIGDTNNFTDLLSTAAGSPGYQYTDTTETPGDQVFYRMKATNVVGATYTAPLRVVIAQNIGSSVWYVDKQATGNFDGTSWTNAFPNFNSISWGNVTNGAIIWIAPGNYNEVAIVGSEGTSNAPILIKLATTNAPHGTVVEDTAEFIAILNETQDWVWWDGSKNDAVTEWLERYATVQTLESGSLAITNFMGFRLYGNTNIGIAFRSITDGFHAKWFDISGPYVNQTEFGEGLCAGFKCAGGNGGNCDIGFSWVHDMTNDIRSGAVGISWDPDSSIGFDGGIFHHLILEKLPTGAIGGGGSITTHDSIMRDWVPPSGTAAHPDTFQCGGGFWKVYNNIIKDNNGTALYVELVQTNTAELYIFNNQVYGTQPNGSLPNAGIIFSTEHNVPGLIIDVMTVSNVLIANNTFYGFDGGYLGGTLRQNQANSLWFTNTTVVNNISVAHVASETFGFGYSIADSNGQSTGLNGTNFGPQSVVLNYNWCIGADTNIGYAGSNYVLSTFGASTGFSSNSSYPIQFVATNTGDFHLTLQDSTNVFGTNLSSFAALLPAITRDAAGYSRGSLGWKPGALGISVDPDLIMWPAFNLYDRTDNILDITPFDNMLILPDSATNLFSPLSTNTPGDFAGVWVDSCHYLGNTNFNQLLMMTNGTIFLRGRFTTTSAGDAVFWDSGGSTDATNGWSFGRDDTTPLRLWVITDNGGKSNLCAFTDSIGGDTGFKSFAVTWSCSGSTLTGVGYSNGVPIVTNTMSPVSRLTVGGTSTRWAALGCRTHVPGTFSPWDNESANPTCDGTNGPTLSYPNNGWTDGPISDFRIYKRTLTADEVLAVFLGQGTGQGSGPLPSIDTFSASPFIISAGQTSTLSWTTTGADTVTIDNGIGSVATTGTSDVTPSVTTTYTLTAANINGSTTAQATVTVNPSTTATLSGRITIKGLEIR